MQYQRAVRAKEFDFVAGAEIGGAAHRQADQRASGKLQRHRHAGFQVPVVRQAGHACREVGDRTTEPFKIMQTMADEIAEHAAAVIAEGLPVVHAQLDGAALHANAR